MDLSTNTITVATQVIAPIETIWKLWNAPEHIMSWNNISDRWHTPVAVNDLRPGGTLRLVTALKSGLFSFTSEGVYDEVIPHKRISYTLDKGRRTNITFSGTNPVTITEAFEPNTDDSIDLQTDFYQDVLDSFKRYAEAILH